MKKQILSLAALCLLFGMVSCSSGLSAEQIESKASEQFEAKKGELDNLADQLCTAQFDGMVKTAADSIVTAELAAQAAAAATPQ